MSDLPLGWRRIKVREAGEVQLGRQRSPKDHSGLHMRPYLRVANVFEDRLDLSDIKEMNFSPSEFSTFELHPGDVLLNEGQSKELVGRPAMYRGEVPGACFQNTLVRFRAFPTVDSEFALVVFRHYLRSGQFQKICKWTTNIAHLGAQRFAEMDFPLPPLEEQRRIAAKFRGLAAATDRCRERLDRIPGILQGLREAVLDAAVSGRLTEAWRRDHPDRAAGATDVLLNERELRRQWWISRNPAKPASRYPAPPEPEAPEALNVPAEWALGSWGEVSNWITYGFTRPMPHIHGGIPIITGRNVKNARIDFEGADTTSRPAWEALSDKDRPKPGDLLITKDGTIGRVAEVTDNRDFCINQSVAVVWLRTSRLNRTFLRYCAEAPPTQSFIAEQARGMAIQHLSITDFSRCALPIPSLHEQNELVLRVNRLLTFCETIGRHHQAAAEALDRVTPAILAKAIRGELVPQILGEGLPSLGTNRVKAGPKSGGMCRPQHPSIVSECPSGGDRARELQSAARRTARARKRA